MDNIFKEEFHRDPDKEDGYLYNMIFENGTAATIFLNEEEVSYAVGRSIQHIMKRRENEKWLKQ